MSAIIYHDRLKQSGDLLALAQQATPIIEEILASSKMYEDYLRPTVGQVEVGWDRSEDERGHPQISVTLRDRLGEVSERFTPEELATPRDLRGRLSWLWDDLLKVRSDRMLQQLFSSNDQGGS